jgi:hypothetical protein
MEEKNQQKVAELDLWRRGRIQWEGSGGRDMESDEKVTKDWKEGDQDYVRWQIEAHKFEMVWNDDGE